MLNNARFSDLHMHQAGVRMTHEVLRDGEVYRKAAAEVFDFRQQGKSCASIYTTDWLQFLFVCSHHHNTNHLSVMHGFRSPSCSAGLLQRTAG